jgi:hypothetical protein
VPEIVSASRRTDVPAFHARWLANRVRAGFCHWVHPYTGRVCRVSLRPEDVHGFVLWTRDPGPLLRHLAVLEATGRPLFFHFTITGEGPPVESHNPPRAVALRRFEELAARVGPAAIQWRYDPILLADERSADEHRRRFAELAGRLAGQTERCTISFVDFYGKTERNLAPIETARGWPFRRPAPDEKRQLARDLAAIAAERGIAVHSCCDASIVGEGIEAARCVDPAAVARVAGETPPDLPPRPTRKDCGCARSVDVGAYDTCAFGCAYCYAVSSRKTALRRLREADPDDTVLWRPPSLRGVDLATRET